MTAVTPVGPIPLPAERKALKSQDFKTTFDYTVYVKGQHYAVSSEFANQVDGKAPRVFSDQTGKAYLIGYKIDTRLDYDRRHNLNDQHVVKIPLEQAAHYGYVDKAWIAAPVIFAGLLLTGITAVALGAIFFNPAVIAIGSVLIVASLIAPFAAVIGAWVYRERTIEHHDKYHHFDPVMATKVQQKVGDALKDIWVVEDSLVKDSSEDPQSYSFCETCNTVNN